MSSKTNNRSLLARLRRKSPAGLVLTGALLLGQLQYAVADISNSVVVGGSVGGTPVFSVPDTATVPLASPAPSILVDKSAILNDVDASGGVSNGDTIDYAITVQNNGNTSVTGITLTDQLSQSGTAIPIAPPVYLSGDDNTDGILDIGETWLYQTQYTITQPNIETGTPLENVVTVDGNTIGGVVTGTDRADTPLDGVASVALDKVATTTSYARPGDNVEWQITVTNNGAATLSAITVTDNFADTIACTISGDETVATLAPGASEICLADYSVQASDIDNPTIDNIASVTAFGGGTNLSTTATASVPRSGANLVTVKSLVSGVPDPNVGDTVTYNIVVTNNGPERATLINISDQLPAGLTPTANNGTFTAGNYVAATGLWTIASLNSGSAATLTLEGTVDAGQGGQIISNTISAAQSAEHDPTTDGDVLAAIFTTSIVPIVAEDNVLPAPIDGANLLSGVLNVLDNDTLDGSAANPANVTLTPIGILPTGFVLNPDGTVDVGPDVPSGTYSFDYQICQTIDPTNCDVATVTIPVESSLPLLSGTVYIDRNQNSLLDALDTRLPGYIVQLVSGGTVVGETVTDASGEYEFRGFVPGQYDIIFMDPDRDMGVGLIQNVLVGAGETIVDQNQPIDPSGVVYNSASGDRIAGATLTLVGSNGAPLPAACLLPGQQNQVTGANGEYRFDIIAGAAAQCPPAKSEYRIELTQPAGFLPIPSNTISPQAGLLDPGICALDAIPGGSCNLHVDNNPPPVTTPSPYFLQFFIGAGDVDVVYNHIPLDFVPSPATSGLTMAKSAGQSVVRLGDTISYTLTITNSLPNPYNDIHVVDTLPTGTFYTPGSARINGTAMEPTINGRIIEFSPLRVPGDGQLSIVLSARVGQQVSATELTNVVQAVNGNGNQLTNIARATVRLEVDPVFACSTIIGRVYDDLNRNGYADDGEPGLPGVRVATVKGLLITTDEYGRYSVPCAELPDPDTGSNFILKLDNRSLPTGYRVTSENPRVVRATAGKMTTLNFGAAISRVVRIDLSGTAFERNSAQPSAALDRGIDQLVQALETEPSVLRLTYYESKGENDLASSRLEKIEGLVRQRLRRARIGTDLWIETRIVRR